MQGKTLSHYKIIEKIAKGGMGIVYKAEDTRLNRQVAIKVLSPDMIPDYENKKRFLQEAQTASSLDHPNICTIHGIDESNDNQMFIVMSYYKGKTLKQIIEEGPLDLDMIIDYSIQLAEGLSFAHNHNIIHRDIKPSNVFISEEGSLKILDFGLAKLLGKGDITKIGVPVGTAAYMSPEQAMGSEVDNRTDIWSFGVILYEMLTSHMPFRGDYEQAIVYQILNVNYENIDCEKNQYINRLEYIIDECLQKEPDKRYSSIDQILKDLYQLREAKNSDSKIEATSGQFQRRSHSIKQIVSNPIFKVTAPLVFAAIVIFSLLSILNIFNSESRYKIIAVLPLTNSGGDSFFQAGCDGLIDVINWSLIQNIDSGELISVIPASEIRSEKITSAKQAERVFNADLVINGTLRKLLEKTILIINLIDAKSFELINSRKQDFNTSDFMTISDSALSFVAKMLEVQLIPKEMKKWDDGKTQNSEAYNLYVSGCGYLGRYWDQSNVDNAISLFKKSIMKDSTYVLAIAALGKSYAQKYEFTSNPVWIDSAISMKDKALSLNMNVPLVRITSGAILEKTGRYEEAAEQYKKAIELDKNNSEAYVSLASVYSNMNRLEDAERIYKQAIELKPGFWPGYNNLGHFYFTYGRIEEALIQFKKVIELTPDNIFGYNNLGGVYFTLERYEEAEKILKKSLEIRPNYDAYSNLGTIYFFDGGRYSEAKIMYENAIHLDSSEYIIWGNLASSCYWIPEEKSKSFKYYKVAAEMVEKKLSLNPNNAEDLASLASYYSMLGNNILAENKLEEALRLAPDNFTVMLIGVGTYEKIGKRKEALSIVEEILKTGIPSSWLENLPDLKELVNDTSYQNMKTAIEKSNEY